MIASNSTGFTVSYSVRETLDKGKGVFVEESVDSGTILWCHLPGIYIVYDAASLNEHLNRLTKEEIIYELEHLYGLPEFPDHVVRILDDGVLINHSQNPNTAMVKDVEPIRTSESIFSGNAREVEIALQSENFSLISTKKLSPGDELTMDYQIGVEDPPYYEKLYEQYGISSSYL